jgi:hypothetical protein
VGNTQLAVGNFWPAPNIRGGLFFASTDAPEFVVEREFGHGALVFIGE